MKDIQGTIKLMLDKAVARLQTAGVPGDYTNQLHKLVSTVDKPCTIAVVGRMKSGKSSLINALLGADLAQVGVTETTATINYFRHPDLSHPDTPPHPDKPVRCYWRNGGYEDVTHEFLANLQGNDIEALRRARDIHCLEYWLDNPYLKHATIVDTPGISSVVSEHQHRTAEYLNLEKQLQQHHSKETDRISGDSDAIIYVIGTVARFDEAELLEEFHATTRGKARPLNAVGVLAKIDQSPEIIERRYQLATNIAHYLREHLNTVVPVSAGIHRMLDYLQYPEDALQNLVLTLRTIPVDELNKMLASEQLFDKKKQRYLSAAQIQQVEELPWTVFTTVVNVITASQADLQTLRAELADLAGFVQLKEILDQHFFKRSHLLRSYRIVLDTLAVLERIKYEYLLGLHSEIPEAQAQKATIDEVERIYYKLERYQHDFEALQFLDVELFSPSERTELEALFGAHGMNLEQRLPSIQIRHPDTIARRQQYWLYIRTHAKAQRRSQVANRAVHRYGWILDELHSKPIQGSKH